MVRRDRSTKGREGLNLRKCKSHQRPTDHYEVQDVPQVPEVGARVEQQPEVHHLRPDTCWPFIGCLGRFILGFIETYYLDHQLKGEHAREDVVQVAEHLQQRLRDSETQRLRDTETQRLRDSETQRLRDSETQTQSLRDSETQRLRDTETQRLRDSETQRLRDSETQRHRDSETQRHRDSETQRLRDSETQRLRDSETHPLGSCHRSYTES